MTDSKRAIRRERFERVATRRTNNILERIRVLGNCSNRSAYLYADEDVQKIFLAIEKELRSARAKFASRKKSEFRL